MSNYTNLTSENINRATVFFNNTIGQTIYEHQQNTLTIKQIIQECEKDINSQPPIIDPSSSYTPYWVILMGYNHNFYSLISTKEPEQIDLELFLKLGESYPQMNASIEVFNNIDNDSDGLVSFNQLIEYYKIPPKIIPQISLGKQWCEYLKQQENLTDDTQITLSEFLYYNNKYFNTMTFWPN